MIIKDILTITKNLNKILLSPTKRLRYGKFIVDWNLDISARKRLKSIMLQVEFHHKSESAF